jgi:CspA family cold shock protein
MQLSGIIKFYKSTNGYGFIIDDQTKEEVFVHFSGLIDPKSQLKKGDAVNYQIGEGQKGPKAINVEKI